MASKKKKFNFLLVLIFKGFVESSIDNHSIVQISDSDELIFDDEENINFETIEYVGAEKESQFNSGIYFRAEEISTYIFV